ncbi:MAG: DNA internalization-related competence protein ComEC/Rec2 [Candidatus Cloacimonetes bacterium]|nr:DNA internalization-related competence protein ComEC/Rec2 [Candidatus Cloacimonadota bacterium]
MNINRKIKAYKIPKVVKYKLPIPCLIWVPFWLLGIVFARQIHLFSFYKDSISIPYTYFIIPFIICVILFFIPKTRIFSISLISLFAGYLVYTQSQILPENHISNIFKLTEDNNDFQEQKNTYISEDKTWVAEPFIYEAAKYPHIQQKVRGRIVSDKIETAVGFRYTFDLISFSDIPVLGRINIFTIQDSLVYGDIIETTLRIWENRVSNPGEIDYSFIQRQNGIYANANQQSPIVLIGNYQTYNNESKISNLWILFNKSVLRVKKMIHDKYQENLYYSAPMAQSLIIGERQYLSDYADDFYTDTLPLSGLMHFFAVSGFHVGIVALFIMFLLKLCRVPRTLIHIITIILLCFYAFLCNLAPSVVRAVIFFSFFIIAELMSRRINRWQVYLFSLFLVTIFKPEWLFTVSFQFSYLAFAGIIIGQEISNKIVKPKKNLKKKHRVKAIGDYLLNYLIIIGSIQMLIMPAQIYYFNLFNLNALIGNLLGALLVSALLPLFLLILILPVVQPIYGIFVICAEFLTDIFNQYIVFLSELPLAFMLSQNYKELIALFALLCIGFLLIAYSENKQRLYQGILISILSLTLLIPIKNDKGFQLIFFDTGNSDTFLLRFSENDYMIIDTANSRGNNIDINRNLIPYLRKERVKNIQKVLISHEHSDHYGGIFELGSSVIVDTLIVTEKFYNSFIGEEIKTNEHFKNTVFFVIMDTLTYRHKDYKIQFLHPDKDYFHRNENNNSLVCRLELNNLSILFTGDIEIEAERHIVSRYNDLLQSDILKIAHHGSRTSSSENFLSFVKPELAIISARGDERSGFPNSIVLERLENIVKQVYVTGKNGAVVVTIN